MINDLSPYVRFYLLRVVPFAVVSAFVIAFAMSAIQFVRDGGLVDPTPEYNGLVCLRESWIAKGMLSRDAANQIRSGAWGSDVVELDRNIREYYFAKGEAIQEKLTVEFNQQMEQALTGEGATTETLAQFFDQAANSYERIASR